MPNTPPAAPDRHYALVAQAIDYLRSHARAQPDLATLAQALHMSPFQLQRVFSQWAGVSPKRFLQALTHDWASQRLREGASVLEASLDAGLSGPGRLYDLTIHCQAMTPGEIQSGGRGLAVLWGLGTTPLGAAGVAWTSRGICHLRFDDPVDVPPPVDPAAPLQAELAQDWPRAHLARDDAQAQQLLNRVFAQAPAPGRLSVVLRGSNFQIQVWQALLRTTPGQVLSYQQLAALVGSPRAARAVGSALAANRLAYLIPCHRVIRGDGDVGQYRWGSTRKRALLAWESLCSAAAPEVSE
ncbi:MAG: methylated-DNA--[protein]-cysteine S-methyltransferase [Rhodoferax sp.]